MILYSRSWIADIVDNIDGIVVWLHVLRAAMFSADSCLWNAKEWCTENYNMRLVIDIFPKFNIYDFWVGEAKCWLPLYCIRIKMLMLQLCVKHNKNWEMLSVSEWRLGNMFTCEKKEKTDKYCCVWRIWDNGALAFCGHIIFLSVFKLVRCVSCSPVNIIGRLWACEI